jgi:hypothetical protein
MNGSPIEWGSTQEMLAYNAWCRQRMLVLRGLKALVYAPSDAVSESLTKKPSAVEFESFAKDLWPEIEDMNRMALDRQKKVLQQWRDRPIPLRIREGLDGSMDISMDNPLGPTE